jgi:dihydroorotase
MNLPEALHRVTAGPAQIAGLPFGRLDPGSCADICIFDPDAHWTLDENNILSQGKNTPFINWEFTGQVTHTLFEGRITYSLDDKS